MVEQSRIFLGLGSNLGERERNLGQAVSHINEISETIVAKISSIYETEPVGNVEQNTFLNAVLEVRSSLGPFELLQHLQNIEIIMGRVRQQEWGPRVIDLDVLTFGDFNINHPKLTIPHPHITNRRFVLEPLCEIASDLKINGASTIVETLHNCDDKHWVHYLANAETLLQYIREEVL